MSTRLLLLVLLAAPAWAQQIIRTEAPILGTAQLSSWVTKSSDETRTSSTSLTNDGTLQFSMAASKVYHFRIKVFFDTTANADFKFALSGPASPTKVRIWRYHIVPGTTAIAGNAMDTAATASTSITSVSGTTGGYVQLDGVWANGSNAGTLAFQWAQDTSDGGNTSVLGGSQIEWMQAN